MFKNWLVQEETHKNNILKLDIFDFDDTLVHTPSPEKAKELLHQYNIQAAINGNQFIQHMGGPAYWYTYQSLEPPLVPKPCPCKMLNQGIAGKFYTSARNPRCFTTVLTGRPPHLEPQVRRILDDFKMDPNRLMMVPASARTLAKKMEMIADLLDEFPNIEEIELWDDKGPLKARASGQPDLNHISEFKKMLGLFNNYRNGALKFKVNEVPPVDGAVDFLKQYASELAQSQQEKKQKKRDKTKADKERAITKAQRERDKKKKKKTKKK